MHPAKHQFHGLRYYFVYLVITLSGEQIEKIRKWCGPEFVVYSEMSRLERPVWVNLTRKIKHQ